MLDEIYHKTADKDGKPIVVKIRIPDVDTRDALKRFPHAYSRTATGFGKEPKHVAPAVNLQGIVGPTGGNPSMNGGVGVVEIVELPAA